MNDEKELNPKSTVRAATFAAASLVVAGALLAGCGEPTATPMDDEYAGNSGETAESQAQESNGSSDSDSDSSDADGSDSSSEEKQDTGVYADGTYSVNGQYGPIGEDTIDVHVTITDGAIDNVEIVGHPFTTISQNHQDAFAEAINGVVDGKPLKDLEVDTVAGASWTTDAFNEALKVVRQEASVSQ
ncbi:FMN-binding protein [Bifidobacterium eulemuris]|uniref:FMN-binding protein n=1 Tax=Bifidobacterium eulemuris TaxID=1765219 RepID=A0A261GDZ6_9BIFI|nr:FMN-binding protein [Bifidobacterium eulemuris]